jgi:hypothetical protein
MLYKGVKVKLTASSWAAEINGKYYGISTMIKAPGTASMLRNNAKATIDQLLAQN